ncbi:hypothetical protein I3843_10G119200 [Carya illinoinensis]|nr:hypothetical protein I3760_10G126300 [Carya illinoinensis]KAG7960357.1 hypothetical protein I3843_10G119200 [Carya illinoinensis]
MDILNIEFPTEQVGLPKGCESYHLATSPDLRMKFLKAITLLRQPLEELVEDYCLDCLITSAQFPWTTDVARRFGIPRLIFHATSSFFVCASECLRLYEPYKKFDYYKKVHRKKAWHISLLDSKKPDYVVYVCFGSMVNFNDSQLMEINSTLDGVVVRVPMVTWLVSAEQFYNEKLVTQILKIGVGVGAEQWVRFLGDNIGKEAIEKALIRVMVGEKAEEMRSRARELMKMAKSSIEGGRSSLL